MCIRDRHYAVYVLTGQLIYNFFSEATTLCMSSIVSNGSLIRKVYIPKYIFPLSKVAFSFVNMCFSLLAVVIMLLIDGVPVTWNILLFPLPLIYISIFALGVGLLLAALTVFFRDIMHLYSVVLQAWMYLTPIIYPIKQVSGSFVAEIMKFNPMYHLSLIHI